jgi:phage baseplate assembly protein W
MIRQVLLTSPGERIDLPEFGCGLRQLIFAPHSSALDSTTNLIVL